MHSIDDEPRMEGLSRLYAAHARGVIEDVSPDDSMWEHGHPEARERYWFVGQSGLQIVKLAMLAAERDGFERILDFGCGYGRVLRFLKAAYPDALLTACDIVPNAVDFCASTFGAIPVYSHEQPEQIPLKGTFDLIWCGSVLTHLDAALLARVLRLLASHLSTKGVLVCSLHGRSWVQGLRRGWYAEFVTPEQCHKLLSGYERVGFEYVEYEFRYADLSSYGLSVASPPWVLAQAGKLPGLRILTYTERGWANSHDVLACVASGDDLDVPLGDQAGR